MNFHLRRASARSFTLLTLGALILQGCGLAEATSPEAQLGARLALEVLNRATAHFSLPEIPISAHAVPDAKKRQEGEHTIYEATREISGGACDLKEDFIEAERLPPSGGGGSYAATGARCPIRFTQSFPKPLPGEYGNEVLFEALTAQARQEFGLRNLHYTVRLKVAPSPATGRFFSLKLAADSVEEGPVTIELSGFVPERSETDQTGEVGGTAVINGLSGDLKTIYRSGPGGSSEEHFFNGERVESLPDFLQVT